MDALAVTDISKRYRATTALDTVSLSVAPGQLVGLLGPNGAGKSTLVKIAVGLSSPDTGIAAVCGSPSTSREARASLGYLAELFRFSPWLNADELLGMHQRLAGSDGGETERTRLLTLVGLAFARDRRIGAMSKGMQQRLGIAQALIGSPRMLFLDEPTSALDPEGRHLVRGLLEQLRADGIAVLLNSHLLSEIELVCDRVAILVSGRIIAEGEPRTLMGASFVEITTDIGTETLTASSREAIADHVAGLVAQGRRIYAVTESHRSLEDAYLDLVHRSQT